MSEAKEDLGIAARKDIRIYSQLPMNYQVVFNDGRKKEVVSTLTKDISSGGVLFESNEVLPIDASVKLTLSLPGVERNIEAMSSIVRVEEIEFKRQYNIGVEFKEIKEEDREEILNRIAHLDIVRVLDIAVEKGASDVHLTNDMPPLMRLNNRLVQMQMPPLGRGDLKNMIYSVLSREQIAIFEQAKELDLAFSPSGRKSRFRVNVHQQMGNVEATFRIIPMDRNTLESLGLPSVIGDFANLKKGIVIIAGPTNSGKTTTLSAMIDRINKNRDAVIISLEKPVEYIHKNEKSIIKQREVGIDTNSFASGFQSTLRQDPDVIVVGEMSDQETIRTAIIAAETGHLVLSSIHAPDTAQIFDRIVSVFPSDQQRQIAQQLSRCFQGSVTQLLLPGKQAATRVVVTEVLVVTDAVRHTIRDMNFTQFESMMQTGAKYGMHLMKDSLKILCDKGLIDIDTYMSYTEE